MKMNDSIKGSLAILLLVLIIFFVGGHNGWYDGFTDAWLNPIENFVPVTWYWQLGSFLALLFASPSSIAIYILLCVWGLKHWFYYPKQSKASIIRRQRKRLEEIDLQLRFAQSKINKHMNKILQYESIFRFVQERSCPNCLASIEEWIDLEALV